MNKTSTNTAYVPGVCNINTTETAYRRKAGYLFAAITVVIVVLLFVSHMPPLARLVVFFPAMTAAICFLQARNRFCVKYASMGQQNAEEGGTSAKTVADKERELDRKKARKMNLQAAAIALVLTAALYFIPIQ